MNISGDNITMHKLEGKVAFITGGDSGVGLGIARAFVNAGMQVVITYLSKIHRDEALQALSGERSRVHAIRVDVTDRAGMEAAAAETVRVFGKVHVLVNNAAVAPTTSLSNATFDDWDWCWNVNVNGVFNGIHAFLPYLKSQNEGAHIVTTSSIFGLAIFRYSQGVYSTTKFAVIGMMEALRTELANSNIGVSVFCPGPVKSNMVDCERNRPKGLGNSGKPDPEELAAIEEGIKALPERVRGDLASTALDPIVVGERVLQGIRNNELYILSHPEFEKTVRDRCEALLASMSNEQPPAGETRSAFSRVIHNMMYSNELDRQRRAH